MDKDIATKEYFYKIIYDALQPFIEERFTDYRICRIAVVIKGINGNSSCNIHTDDNYLDENRSTPLNIWTPLVSTNETNGGLNIIPKSHHFASKIRGFGIPQYYRDYQNELMKYGVCLPTELGGGLTRIIPEFYIFPVKTNLRYLTTCHCNRNSTQKSQPLLSILVKKNGLNEKYTL